MTAPVGDIIQNAVGKVADRLADKFLPSSVSDEDRLKLRLEAEMLALREYKTAIADVKGAHEGVGKEEGGVPSWVRTLTATHRPMWSFLTLGIFAWAIFAPYAGYPQISLSETHKDIIQVVVIFYFAGRSIEKVAALVWGR